MRLLWFPFALSSVVYQNLITNLEGGGGAASVLLHLYSPSADASSDRFVTLCWVSSGVFVHHR